MQLNNPGAEIFVPDGTPVEQALARTTHLAVGAHQDDLEIMAYRGILECFQQPDKWFCGVNVTNGAGSPRDDLYKDYTDEMMQVVRRKEQKKAAVVGEYTAQIFLDYSSAATKDGSNPAVKEDLKKVFLATRPRIVYTHNLADKHDTHVAVTLRVIAALRELPDDAKPQQVLGCEVWRDLDWMADSDKVPMDVSAHENLAAALLGVFDSQICGGKRYDLATMGRRRAHATYFESHGVDVSTSLIYGMDLTPLIKDPTTDVFSYVQGFIDRFAQDVRSRIEKVR
jgi:LmbE family N-acetylglucosaminyl deacetylase